MTVLVVDDEEALLLGLKKSLKREGYTVLTATDGEACLEVLTAERVDLVILDVMLPRLDGMTVCRRIREKNDTPVIMLTAKDDVIDRVMGLESGADDYLAKPFHTRELIARVRSVLRRTNAAPREDAILTVGPVSLDRGRRSVRCRGRPVELTAREFDILAALMARPGVVASREALLDAVCGEEGLELRTVDVHVSRLREKLEEEPGGSRFIRTKWGVGYYVSEI
jgi:two-component system, OmpR family, response regulator VicR